MEWPDDLARRRCLFQHCGHVGDLCPEPLGVTNLVGAGRLAAKPNSFWSPCRGRGRSLGSQTHYGGYESSVCSGGGRSGCSYVSTGHGVSVDHLAGCLVAQWPQDLSDACSCLGYARDHRARSAGHGRRVLCHGGADCQVLRNRVGTGNPSERGQGETGNAVLIADSGQ